MVAPWMAWYWLHKKEEENNRYKGKRSSRADREWIKLGEMKNNDVGKGMTAKGRGLANIAEVDE